MGLFDVHAHLTHPDLLPRIDQLLANARAAGVSTIVSNGLNPKDNSAVLELAARYPMVKPALGLYPVDAVLAEMRTLDIPYARDEEPCDAEHAVAWVEAHVAQAFAVGEIGLDGHWVPETLWPRQEEIFRRLVQVAMVADKAIIIHTRRREKRAFEILCEMGATRVNWHCFGGKVKLARQIAEYGHYFSIPANARRSESFTRMLQTLPRERLLLETDCPYLAPTPGAENEPANVAETAAFAAELWGVEGAAVTALMGENFTRLFAVAP